MFPDMKMQLLIWAPSPPNVAVCPTGLDLTFSLDTQAVAVLPDSSLAPLFLLEMVSCSWVRADGEPWTGPRAWPSESEGPV